MATLVDSNVLLDVLTNDPRWGRWSMDALASRADRDVLAINPIIYAEVSIGFDRIEVRQQQRCLIGSAAMRAQPHQHDRRRRGASTRKDRREVGVARDDHPTFGC